LDGNEHLSRSWQSTTYWQDCSGRSDTKQTKDKRYPKNIRDVVTEPYQFSWYNTKQANTPPANNSRWKESYEVAKLLLTKAIGSDIIKLLEGATHFHAIGVKPDWINKVHRIAQIEGHIFYR